MIHLKEADFCGSPENIAEVLKNFGDIYLGGAEEFGKGSYVFTIKRFTNWYKDNEGVKPLYVLIPNRTIIKVWPDDTEKYLEIKYGTATRGLVSVTAGIILHNKNRIGLYICLDPAGDILEDEDSFGI
jgi:hypothetical protein